ncbi:hypothetical protein GGR51DRAFT_31443 [Nemania sp. FL0031]|nr:hypothetical protein GGR51DRAFT_31443 [Nemania sp. FL0031]
MPPICALLASALAASLSAAHVVLENPKPYHFVSDGPTNPLSSTGSDFPCKIPPGQSYIIDGEPTPMTIGEDQTATFSGQAVHGGGSCQFAVTRGFPTKDSSWQVIHSIEGGCPARNQKGNLDGPNTDKYTFQIPEGIEPGNNYTFAWLWANREGGQPEFYMNCAPINILPSSKKRMSPPARRNAIWPRAAPSFPELFLANLGDYTGDCTTNDAMREQIAIAYPDPGTSIERNDANLFKQPCDGNPHKRNPVPAQNGGNGTSPAMSPTSSAATSSSSIAATTSLVSTSSISKSTSMSMSMSMSMSTGSEVTKTGTEATSMTVTPTATTLVSVTATATAVSSGSSSASTVSAYFPLPAGDPPKCTEGHLTCLADGTHFATCTGGQLTAPQPIAPGYKCQPGEGVGLEISPIT